MIVYRNGNMPSGERVIALGFFDGVHRGHGALLSAAREKAGELSVPFAVFTFVAEGEIKGEGPRLYGTEEKLSLLELAGADEVILAEFNDLRGLLPEEFVSGYLIGTCGARHLVVGRDFRFGRGAVAGASELCALAEKRDTGVTVIDDVRVNGRKASTTEIKNFLRCGDVRAANEMLGRPYSLAAVVEHGRGVGRGLGFPTLNLSLAGKEGLLCHGVYFSRVRIGEKYYPALTNVGTCPTFDARPEHAEAYVLGFEGDLYGERVRVYLYEFMREEIAFSTPEALKMQINVDIERAKQLDKEIDL